MSGLQLRIGTRASRLALAQAEEVARRLASRGTDSRLVPMTTAGDRLPSSDQSAAAAGAGVKGLFVADVVRAVLEGRVDLAVHSAKDLPAQDTEGVVTAAVPERADPHDVLVTREGTLGQGGVVGTSSLRRRALVARMRPDVSVRDLRGNVDTRLSKLRSGEVDALVLAAAGLARLGVYPPHVAPIALEDMVPAPGQGALAVQARSDDERAVEAAMAIDHVPSRLAFEAERALVARMGGGCALPLGALATSAGGWVDLITVVLRPDGSDPVWVRVRARSPGEVAAEAARRLHAGGAEAILAEVRAGLGADGGADG